MAPGLSEEAEQETEALRYIFEEENVLTTEEEGEMVVRVRTIAHQSEGDGDGDGDGSSFMIAFAIPASYPAEHPPRLQVQASWLSPEISSELFSGVVESLFSPGCPVLFDACETVRESIPRPPRPEQSAPSNAKRDTEKEGHGCVVAETVHVAAKGTKEEKEKERLCMNQTDQTANPSERKEEKEREDTGKGYKRTKGYAGPEVFHGTPFVDRKSVFQAHVAQVTSMEEVTAVREELMSCSSKIARATHNIMAYRFRGAARKPRGGKGGGDKGRPSNSTTGDGGGGPHSSGRQHSMESTNSYQRSLSGKDKEGLQGPHRNLDDSQFSTDSLEAAEEHEEEERVKGKEKEGLRMQFLTGGGGRRRDSGPGGVKQKQTVGGVSSRNRKHQGGKREDRENGSGGASVPPRDTEAEPPGSQSEVLHQDHDSDGETAAGGRLQHLLAMTDTEGVVVVVSRWFGGIQLGPDRFKHINNVSRQLLEETGFIGQKTSGKSGEGDNESLQQKGKRKNKK
uniref:RWD domain-containing protein n=1 Tax=Chromera velia CCMP2878 TaxID=1169474 RepID=A0A0G4FH36_9ALVE|eukprot:Cvel_17010.t1-p1 / transcript=Cvel_17010.t1 / gene=Cvel_17010 / organism=Chromera_velia_CCMP2878 / gene_product=Protein IMPACT, putative / transcript_product=Protein IMPACT, putative / location=Cvel_scaffold1337:7638-10385(+) / protein_length=509 / sequence_SO=supercontig / SO=protein_coding / is_pseudo=false